MNKTKPNVQKNTADFFFHRQYFFSFLNDVDKESLLSDAIRLFDKENKKILLKKKLEVAFEYKRSIASHSYCYDFFAAYHSKPA